MQFNPLECRIPKNSEERYKAFFIDQCKEIEKNNRMGKTRDLLGKIGDIKGTFYPKVGTIKDRDDRDQVDIKKR